MNATSNLPKDLQGKEIFLPQAQLDICLRFGLWQDYKHWLDPAQQLVYWYDQSVLDQAIVTVAVTLGNNVFFSQKLTEFGMLEIHHVFDDEQNCAGNLEIEISNFGTLPVRNDTGSFVCGMIEIQSVKLQDIEIVHLLPDTMFGVDSKVNLPIEFPVYSWLVKNWSEILKPTFKFSMFNI